MRSSLASRTESSAFDLSTHLDARPAEAQLETLAERQDQIFASIYNKLNTHRNLRKGRFLAVPLHVVTCHETLDKVIRNADLLACPPSLLFEAMQDFGAINHELLRPLNAAIQRVATLRPLKRRENVSKEDSRGAILKRIEREIANLDQWQN